MENIGDWLYVVILIIAGISSLISSISKKKKTAEQPPLPEIITVNDDSDDHLFRTHESLEAEGFFEKKQRNKPQGKYPPKAQTQAEPAPTFTEPETYTTIALEDLPSDTDEWRKAFIYKEIFERKY